jgi:hypothetical protein
VGDVGIIAGIFDDAAVSLVSCIGTRVQLKGDELTYGETNPGSGKAPLVDERQ